MKMLPILRTRNSWPNLMDEFFSNNEFLPRFNYQENYSVPAVNVKENNNEYQIEVAAPGLGKNDFKVNVENDVLTISSEKENNVENSDEKVMRREFSYSKFSRSFILPEDTDYDKIKATHKDGILNVIVPKKEEAKVKPAREIKIS
ncbi:MAG: Hsp20/alpha crystallin family protein [Bacteroidales bacterium]|nr:Hsp20/alpha crystallin family protein [Bacteroidales bacterium]